MLLLHKVYLNVNCDASPCTDHMCASVSRSQPVTTDAARPGFKLKTTTIIIIVIIIIIIVIVIVIQIF